MCFLVELFFLIDFYIKPPLVISIEEWDFEIGNSLTDYLFICEQLFHFNSTG